MAAICSLFIIWYGVLFGILDWISDIVYYASTTFDNFSLNASCATFIIIQPIWYLFLFIIYMASHSGVETGKERFKLMLLAPLYGVLQYSKVLSASPQLHEFFLTRFHLTESFKLITLENCFKV